MSRTPAPHPLLDHWLSGTTCYRYWIARSVLFESAEYIVLKHGKGRISRKQVRTNCAALGIGFDSPLPANEKPRSKCRGGKRTQALALNCG